MTTTVTITETPVEVTVEEQAVTATITEQKTEVTVNNGISDHGALSGLSDDDHTQYLLKAGGTMTGALVLAGDPAAALQAATKQYVDAQAGATSLDDLGDVDAAAPTDAQVLTWVDANSAWEAADAAGAGDVGDLTTVGLTAANMLRVAAAGGLEERTPAQVLADIGAAASGHNHDADYVDVAGDTMTGALSMTDGSRTGVIVYQSLAGTYERFSFKVGSTFYRVQQQSLIGESDLLYNLQPHSSLGNVILEQYKGLNFYIQSRIPAGAGTLFFRPNEEQRLALLKTAGTTNAIGNLITIHHNISGTPAAGFGLGILYQLESSTTENRDAARIAALWNDATDATRKADLVLSAYDTAAREGLRIRGNGSAPAIAFLGATPQTVQDITGSAGGNVALQNLLTALANLGLITDSTT